MKTVAGFRRAWEPLREGNRHNAIAGTRLAPYADERDFPAVSRRELLPALAVGVGDGRVSRTDDRPRDGGIEA